jgi:hypothetical protein
MLTDKKRRIKALVRADGSLMAGADTGSIHGLGAKLQGANLGLTELWLVDFPRDLANQSPAALGLADLKMSPLSPEAKTQLKQDLSAGITDAAVLAVVMSRLDEVLRNEPPSWDDESSWSEYLGNAKEPSAAELARFHAALACDDTEGSVATSMAARATELATEPSGKAYAKAFAAALLDETCKGGKALTAQTRAALKTLVSAPE